MKNYTVLVTDPKSKGNTFRHDLEYPDDKLLLVRTAEALRHVYAESGTRIPGDNAFVTISDGTNSVSSWSVDLNTGFYDRVEVPCGECLGSGAIDSGGVSPSGSPIELPCPSCKDIFGDYGKANNHRPECRCDACYVDLLKRVQKYEDH